MEIFREFWQELDVLYMNHEVVIDRPKLSTHPKYKSIIYPLDYGYLENTMSSDGNAIDVWRGNDSGKGIVAVVCTIDNLKKDMEVKLLIDCSKKEQEIIIEFHNNKYMKGIIIKRYTS